METKLLKILIRMSKYAIYGVIIQVSFYSLAFALDGKAQKKLDEIQLKLGFTQTTLIKTFESIEKFTDFRFAYKRSELPEVKIELNKEIRSMETLLRAISDQSGLSFRRIDRTIHVRQLETEQESVSEILIMDQIEVTGRVADENDEPLPGATVLVKGTTNGTITDINGNFTISEVMEDDVLIISFVGYKTMEISIEGQTTFNVSLEVDLANLDEVVVVGYGTQKRSDITGSVASVPKERLQNLPVTNLMYALQGSTAGLNISQGSSVPGRAGSVSIRGTNSINANTNPLLVVDGVIFFGSTNDINPNDIESIEILKDASAVAIYGTRGSNGVILITTRRGKTGKPTISYNGYTGVENVAHELTPMEPDEYVQKYKDYKIATNNPSTDVLPNTYEINNYNAGITTDWLDVVTQTGKIQDHNISMNGGLENAKYYVNMGYLDQQGVVKGYQYKRFSFRTNVDITPADWISMGTSIFYTHKNMDGGRVNLLNATAMSPYSQPYDNNGEYEIYPMFPELLFTNPMLDLTVDRVDRGNNLNGSGYFEITPQVLKGLRYRMQGSYALQFTRFSQYEGRAANNNSGTAQISGNQTDSWVLENLLVYARDFEKHHVDLTLLYSAQKNQYFEYGVSANGFVNDGLSYNNIEAASAFSANSEANNYTLLSQMARINYSYDDRYMLSLTTRRDGYSAFGKDADKYAVFPSVAIGWNVHNEDFLQSDLINQMKLRFSYGKTGNQAISPTQTANTASATSLAMNDVLQNGVILNDRLGNSYLQWETTIQTNLGIDFAVLRNRIKGTLDLFSAHTKDLLLLRNLPRTSGSTQTWANLGELKNEGVEITLQTSNVQVGGFRWETNLNFSSFRNKIVELYGDGQDDIGNRWFIGEPLGVIYDYEMLGVWQEDEDPSGTDPSAQPGDLKFKDQLTVDANGDGVPDEADGVITAEDKVVLGQTNPKWYGGITNIFHYKNFHLNIFIQTSQGALKNDVDASYADERGRRNIPQDVGYWTPENKSNEWPGLAYNNSRGYGYPRDNSYTRLKDITLSYTFPRSILKRINLGSLTAYVAGRNLATFTNGWIGWDPESNQTPRGSNNGQSNSWIYNYPYVRSFVFGINVSL